jgi:hypothetical protein
MREKGTVTGMEPKVDEYVSNEETLAKLEKRQGTLGDDIRGEIDALVIAEEKNGVSVRTISVAGTDGRGLQVVYADYPKQIPEDKLPEIREDLGPWYGPLLREETTVTLTGKAAERFIAESEKIDLYTDVDPDIKIAKKTTLCEGFLAKRVEVRRAMPPNYEEGLNKLSRDYVRRPSLKVVKPKKEK